MVATVHSFLWSAVSPFQRDIKRWAREQAGSRLAEREAKQRSFGSRAGNIQQAKVESDIEKLRQQIAKLDSVDRFRYGLGTDFGRGVTKRKTG
jgi:DNA helicase-2/ATP-dependent DNA helicase PcrA